LTAGKLSGNLEWNDIQGVPLAAQPTKATAGLVKLSDVTEPLEVDALYNSGSFCYAATPRAVSIISKRAAACVQKSGDKVTGDLVVTGGGNVQVGAGGRLGVGISIDARPQYTLDVGGDANIRDRLLLNGSEVVFPDSPWQTAGGRVLLPQDLRVGLGVTDPLHALHIAGDVGMTGKLFSESVPLRVPWKQTKDAVILHDGLDNFGSDCTTKNVGIGITHPTYRLHVVGGIYATDKILQSSDQRMKHLITPIQGALDKIDRLSGYTYCRYSNHKCAPVEHMHTTHAGVIAQEVQAVLPQAVSTDPVDGSLAVDYGGLTALLLEAVKGLRQELSELKQNVKTTTLQ
jgi:hypothetical protein